MNRSPTIDRRAGSIYRSARTLIAQHGKDAPIRAAQQANKCLEAGDMDGVAVWKRIFRAVNGLLYRERPNGTVVH